MSVGQPVVAQVLQAKEALYEMGLDTQERALQKEADAQEIAYQEALEAARKQVTEQREVLREHLQLRFDMIQHAYDDETLSAAEAQQAFAFEEAEARKPKPPPNVPNNNASHRSNTRRMRLNVLNARRLKPSDVLRKIRHAKSVRLVLPRKHASRLKPQQPHAG